jgi:hypothetical protein
MPLANALALCRDMAVLLNVQINFLLVLNLENHFELEGSIDPLVISSSARTSALSKALYELAERMT